MELNDLTDRAGDGHCRKMTPDIYKGWADMTGNLVRPSEYDMLRAMDAAFCSEMNKELAAARAQQADKK